MAETAVLLYRASKTLAQVLLALRVHGIRITWLLNLCLAMRLAAASLARALSYGLLRSYGE